MTSPETPAPVTPATPGTVTATHTATTRTSTAAPAPSDATVTTRHTLRTASGELPYTATTGRIVLREEVYDDGVFQGTRAKAEVFLTAYTADDADPTTRPVAFVFNGGPGSASLWLHLGLLGPRRVLAGDTGEPAAPPYALVDNAESLLAHTDLVFIDPMSTGYTRAAEGQKPGDYHGYAGDISAIGELIRLWTSRQSRWLSPKFVIGESYGTLRGAALAEHLQGPLGMYLNGLVLISSVLDLSSIDFENQRNDRAHALYLPFYAATAHRHGKHPGRSRDDVVAEAQEYADRDYPWVLSRGSRLTAAERADAVATLARLTGLSEEYVDRADLRIEHWRYFGELLRAERRTVGRLDSRFTGPAASAIAEEMDADPSFDAIDGGYTAAINHYLRAELGYENDLPYERIAERVHPWSYADFEGRPIDVSPLLERAMRRNPHLLVHVAFGVYDGATPPAAAEQVLALLRLPDELRGNIEKAYYNAGHMMYVHEESRVRQSADLADFIRRASRQAPPA
ncbi:MAG: peptidase S10 [Actinobacteria bacterium]|uniref:Peptidase S10 n=1 Tax=Nostocoides veronense TaxID=330836 RepID=A0ABP4Y5U2_9MICO|nr:peptidase S10 [Actinomycetota bacterium]